MLKKRIYFIYLHADARGRTDKLCRGRAEKLRNQVISKQTVLKGLPQCIQRGLAAQNRNTHQRGLAAQNRSADFFWGLQARRKAEEFVNVDIGRFRAIWKCRELVEALLIVKRRVERKHVFQLFGMASLFLFGLWLPRRLALLFGLGAGVLNDVAHLANVANELAVAFSRCCARRVGTLLRGLAAHVRTARDHRFFLKNSMAPEAGQSRVARGTEATRADFSPVRVEVGHFAKV